VCGVVCILCVYIYVCGVVCIVCCVPVCGVYLECLRCLCVICLHVVCLLRRDAVRSPLLLNLIGPTQILVVCGVDD